jgi:hypothetical protein
MLDAGEASSATSRNIVSIVGRFHWASSVVPRDKMLNVLDKLKWRKFLQYAAGVTGQFKAEMGQQTSHIL